MKNDDLKSLINAEITSNHENIKIQFQEVITKFYGSSSSSSVGMKHVILMSLT